MALRRDVNTIDGNGRPESLILFYISALGTIDAALGRKQLAILEAKQAVETLPIAEDAVLRPLLVFNLATVYAWTNEADLAFEELAISVRTPPGVSYGQLKCDSGVGSSPYRSALRKVISATCAAVIVVSCKFFKSFGSVLNLFNLLPNREEPQIRSWPGRAVPTVALSAMKIVPNVTQLTLQALAETNFCPA